MVSCLHAALAVGTVARSRRLSGTVTAHRACVLPSEAHLSPQPVCLYPKGLDEFAHSAPLCCDISVDPTVKQQSI